MEYIKKKYLLAQIWLYRNETSKFIILLALYLLEFDKNFIVINLILIDCCVKSRNVQHRSFDIDSKKGAKKKRNILVDFNCAIK